MQFFFFQNFNMTFKMPFSDHAIRMFLIFILFQLLLCYIITPIILYLISQMLFYYFFFIVISFIIVFISYLISILLYIPQFKIINYFSVVPLLLQQIYLCYSEEQPLPINCQFHPSLPYSDKHLEDYIFNYYSFFLFILPLYLTITLLPIFLLL